MSAPHDPGRRASGPFVSHLAFCVFLSLSLSACGAPKPIALPADPGQPLSDFASVHAQLAATCAGVRTLRGELGLSGRVGDERLRGRVHAGFERPASMRLEGVAPFGQPIFILAARGGTATLLLPGDQRIIRNAMPEDILEALAGVALGPADLLAVFTGCVLPAPRPTGGRVHAGNWASIAIERGDAPGAAAGAATVYLQREGSRWRVRAARRDRWQIEYGWSAGTFPESVRLLSTAGRDAQVDIRAALSQIEANVDLEAAAFAVEERQGLMPLTVEELREAGPLRGQ